MAYTRRRSTSRRSTARGARSSSARTSYRSRSASRPVRRATTRKRASGGGRTIRIEVVQAPANTAARPELFATKPVVAKKAKF